MRCKLLCWCPCCTFSQARLERSLMRSAAASRSCCSTQAHGPIGLRRLRHGPPARRQTRLRASSGEPDGVTSESMSLEEAEATLNVSRSADFETIMQAKKSQIRKAGQDLEQTFRVEAAYDALLMQNFRARMSGQLNVDDRVRYADVPSPRKSAKKARSSALQNLPAGIKVSIPPTQQLGAVSASYGALIIWAYIQGATEPFAAQQSDLASLQLALGSIGGIYYLQRQKGVGLWRACLYGLAGLSAGVAVGALIEQWARVDIVPILGLGSPGVFQAEFGLLGLAAATICLA